MTIAERDLVRKTASSIMKKQAAKRNRQLIAGVATAAGLVALPFVVFVTMIRIA
jgi:hypothetical protein